jgi:acyl-CoA reductase-like NAD-dependent aldehyde dehydrogenase
MTLSHGKLEWPADGHHVFVGGEWTRLPHDNRIDNVSPIDGSLIGYVPAANGDDLQRAVEEIRPALEGWAAKSTSERAKYLDWLGEAILAHEDEIVELENIDSGLITKSARADVRECLSRLRFYAGMASEIKGDTLPSAGDAFAFTLREPYGIVARITAFNHPFSFAVNSAAPVLLAGNALILKPSEHCSLATLALAEIAREIFPPGIFNVMTGLGHELGDALSKHPDIPRIGFTGSVPTGRAILGASSAHVKTVTLELGGKNPLVVDAGSDPDFAADIAVKAMNFINAGQSCKSSSRALIHSSLYEPVVSRIAAKMSKLKIGDPRDPDTNVGPLASKDHFDRVLRYLAVGREEGAKAVTGGGRAAGFDSGFYVEPTLFSDVSQSMRIASEEIFGPVLVAIGWDTDSELEKIMNATRYGLFARVVTPSMERGLQLARKLEAGTVLVNTASHGGLPFGGFRESGLGKQTCLEEVLSYTREKAVAICTM